MKPAVSLLIASFLVLAGCTTTTSNPEQVKERAADTTAKVKSNVQAVAEGVRDGWNRDHPLNINTATAEELQTLPGITPETAQQIIAKRPYATAPELISKEVLTRAEYDRIADRVTAQSQKAK